MKRRNLIVLGLALAALAGLVVWALQPKPVAVEEQEVARGVFDQAVTDDGRTRVRDRYVIAAPLAGHVERIRLDVGDPVKRGQVVALLTPTAPAFIDARTARELGERSSAAEARLARAKAETAKVLAQRDQASADLQRQARLAKEGFVSQNVREQAELALRTAERAVDASRFAEDAARYELAQARVALTRYQSGSPGAKWEVASPVDGRVLKLAQKSEGPVGLGAALIEIADTRSLEAVIDVLSQEAVAVRPGMLAWLEVGQGLPPFGARVRLVEPAAFTKVSALGVEEQRVNVVLDFTEAPERVEALGDGYRVEAQIVVYRQMNAVMAPVAALFRDGEGWAVFVVQGERATKRAVKSSRRNVSEALIDDGLQPGERIVVYPSDALRDGSKVAIIRRGQR